MALQDARIVRQNPWWTARDWVSTDPHLRRLRDQPRRLPAPLVDVLDLDVPGVHTVRGPRQVGKSTNLKLLAERALREGRSPRQVVYLSLDLLQDQPLTEVAATVERARTLARVDGSALLLLDEVTAVADWQVAVKALWDEGVLDRDVVVCTGSSAIDLAQGAAERLPGRRGAGGDHLVLPQPFSAFCRALDAGLPASPGLTLAELFEPDGRNALEEAVLHRSGLDDALGLYLRFGGLPAAVAEAVGGAAHPSHATQRVVADALVKEVQRMGASQPAAWSLLERVARSLGSRCNWSHLAREMDVPLGGRRRSRRQGTDYRTVRDHIERLAAGYLLLVVYSWRADADSNAVSKDKKLYFGDPLLHTVTLEHAPGLVADEAALVENALALALLRRYEPGERQFEGFGDPGDLHVWSTARGGEIDFVCGPRDRVDALEVKYRRRVDRRTAMGMTRAFPGRPVVIATKETLELRGDDALVPASLLLWAL